MNFKFIKQVLIVLFSSSRSLTTRSVSLINAPCVTSPSLIDLNCVKFKYCSFMINQNKCNGSCNSFDNLFTKICYFE